MLNFYLKYAWPSSKTSLLEDMKCSKASNSNLSLLLCKRAAPLESKAEYVKINKQQVRFPLELTQVSEKPGAKV